MIAANATYQAALRHSHESVIRVTAYDGLTLIGELPVLDLTMNLGFQSDIRRDAVIRVAVDPLLSETRDVLEALSVQQGVVVIEHGITYGDKLVGGSMVQLARLRIDSISSNISDSFRTIRCFDRALLLQEHLFPTIRPLNDTYVNLITALIQETLPGEVVTVGPGVNTALTPSDGKSFSRGDDRLRKIQEMADALDSWVINEPDGSFTIEAWPETGSSVWDIDEGVDGVLIEVGQEFARREQYNAVGIEFTPADNATTFSGFVYLWDNDPTSPTYYDGPFGKRNIFFTEAYDHLPSVDEAEAVATKKLLEYSGATRSVTLTAVYNPLLLPGDRVTVKIPDQASEVHILDDISMSFGSSASMTATTRLDRPLTVIGGLSP